MDVDYTGVKGLPELPVFGMRFIMPTLADKYMYKGLSGETYPDRKAGAEKGIYEVIRFEPDTISGSTGMWYAEWIQSGWRLQDIQVLIIAERIVHHRHYE